MLQKESKHKWDLPWIVGWRCDVLVEKKVLRQDGKDSTKFLGYKDKHKFHEVDDGCLGNVKKKDL
jgi:hypothetical protein